MCAQCMPLLDVCMCVRTHMRVCVCVFLQELGLVELPILVKVYRERSKHKRIGKDDTRGWPLLSTVT